MLATLGKCVSAGSRVTCWLLHSRPNGYPVAALMARKIYFGVPGGISKTSASANRGGVAVCARSGERLAWPGNDGQSRCGRE